MSPHRTTQTLSTTAPAVDARGPTSAPAAAGGLNPLLTYASENICTGAHPAISGEMLLSTQPPPHDPVVADTFDRGAVVELIGPSKTRKSFFAMQIALGLAAGRDVCGLGIREPVSVLLVNLELTPADFHRRLWRMGRALGITAADVGDRLIVLNLRDSQAEAMQIISEAVASGKYFGIIIDPIYPLLIGDESRPETWAPITALFNRWATECGFVLYVHHDCKGAAGDRDIRDRGAGSGVAGRNAYARLTLTQHRDDPDNSVVLNFMLRGYAPRDGITLRFEDDAFHVSDAAPTAQTARDRQARRGVVTVTPVQALALVADKPIRASAFMAQLSVMGLAEKRARALRDGLIDDGTLSVLRHGFPSVSWYGTPSGIRDLQATLERGDK
jgi:hypothetical protein